jgi:hypothetical protein
MFSRESRKDNVYHKHFTIVTWNTYYMQVTTILEGWTKAKKYTSVRPGFKQGIYQAKNNSIID